MEQNLIISVKDVKCTNQGCVVMGKILAGSIEVGNEVFVQTHFDVFKVRCRGLMKPLKDSNKAILVEKACAGEELPLLFQHSDYKALKNAFVISKQVLDPQLKFCLETELQATELENRLQQLKTHPRVIVEFIELEREILGNIEIIDNKIIVETMYPLCFQSGDEVSLQDVQSEILRGKTVKI